MTEDLAELVAQLQTLIQGDRPASPWLNAQEVAERLRLKPKTVHNMTGPNAKNPIPFYRLSTAGENRFHVEEVDEWLRGC